LQILETDYSNCAAAYNKDEPLHEGIRQSRDFHDFNYLWIICSVTDKEKICLHNLFLKVIKLAFLHWTRMYLIGLHQASSCFGLTLSHTNDRFLSHTNDRSGHTAKQNCGERATEMNELDAFTPVFTEGV
jgi:hypothetical protein